MLYCFSWSSARTDSIVNTYPLANLEGALRTAGSAPDGVSAILYYCLVNGFTLLRLGPRSSDGAGVAEAARKSGVPLDILDVADTATRDLYEADLVLIRPDQNITWRGSQSPSNASAIVARIVGA